MGKSRRTWVLIPRAHREDKLLAQIPGITGSLQRRVRRGTETRWTFLGEPVLCTQCTQDTTRQALFQTRWKVRTNTKACPLTLTHAWWHVGTYIHTHEWVHTNTCCIQMILSWQILFFFVMLYLNCSCSDFKWVFKGLCSYGHSLIYFFPFCCQFRSEILPWLPCPWSPRGGAVDLPWVNTWVHVGGTTTKKMNQFSHFINFVCIWFCTFFS